MFGRKAESPKPGPERTVEQVLSLILDRMDFSGPLAARAGVLRKALADSGARADITVIDSVVTLIREATINLSRRGHAMRQACATVTEEFHHAAAALATENGNLDEALSGSRARIQAAFRQAETVYGDPEFRSFSALVEENLSGLAQIVRDTREHAAKRMADLHSELDRARRTLEETTQDLTETIQVANTDMLTGIANRLGFNQRLIGEMHRFDRHGMPLSLLYMDIDQFKPINDTFGHAVGDRVLMELGRLLQKGLREEDLPARLGGDEFAILLPHLALEKAHAFADRLRRIISEHRGFRPVERVTVSIGVASAEKGEDYDAFISRADKAMYIAKFSGTNQACALSAKDDFELLDPETMEPFRPPSATRSAAAGV